jgi:hypothetical protein
LIARQNAHNGSLSHRSKGAKSMWVVYRFVDGDVQLLVACTSERMAMVMCEQYNRAQCPEMRAYYYAAPRDGYFA